MCQCLSCLTRLINGRSRSFAAEQRNMARQRVSSVTVVLPVPLQADIIRRLAVLRTRNPGIVRETIVHPRCDNCNVACVNTIQVLENPLTDNTPRVPELLREPIVHPICPICNIVCINAAPNQEVARPLTPIEWSEYTLDRISGDTSRQLTPIAWTEYTLDSDNSSRELKPAPWFGTNADNLPTAHAFVREPIVHPRCANCDAIQMSETPQIANPPRASALLREPIVHPRCDNCNVACINTIQVLENPLTDNTPRVPELLREPIVHPICPICNIVCINAAPNQEVVRTLTPIEWFEYTLDNSSTSTIIFPHFITSSLSSNITSSSSGSSTSSSESSSSSNSGSSISRRSSIISNPDQENYNTVDIVQEQIMPGVERICVTSRAFGQGLNERMTIRSSTVQCGVERKLKVTVDKNRINCPSVRLTYDDLNC